MLAKSPHLKLDILGKEIMILLDSGSQIPAISHDFYKGLTSRAPFNTLPVSNVSVTTAIGKKSTTVKQQVCLDVEIEGKVLGFTVLLIPFLTSTVILGNDWMIKNELILNYKNNTIEVAGTVLSGSTVVFAGGASETLLCSRKDREMIVYIINSEEESLKDKHVNNDREIKIVKNKSIVSESNKEILPLSETSERIEINNEQSSADNNSKYCYVKLVEK